MERERERERERGREGEKERELWLSPRWDLNPGLSLAQIIDRRTCYQSAKGELSHRQGQKRSFEFEVYVIMSLRAPHCAY